MASSHVAYETKSGRIVAVHHGHITDEHARELAANYVKFREHARSKHPQKVTKEQIAVISVELETFKPGIAYKVDVKRNKLVEAEKGVSLSVSALQHKGPRPRLK